MLLEVLEVALEVLEVLLELLCLFLLVFLGFLEDRLCHTTVSSAGIPVAAAKSYG